MKGNLKFLNKALLIEEAGKRILVASDLHIGYFESLRKRGQLVPGGGEELKEIKKLIEENEGIDKLIVLGDLKHEFGKIYSEERRQFGELREFLNERKCELVLVKGNHDVLVPFVRELLGIKIVEHFIFGKYAFLHGDKEVKEAYGEKIKYWIVGHGHPAVRVSDKYKEEKFKCFLSGKFKGKEVIILPSFFSGNLGTDPREFEMSMAWKFDLGKFEVRVVGDNGEVMKFGKLKDIGGLRE